MKEFRDGKNTYLAFDYNVGNILKSAYEHNDSDDALIFSKAADILQKDIVDKDNKTFDGIFSIDCQKNYLLQCLQLFFDIKNKKFRTIITNDIKVNCLQYCKSYTKKFHFCHSYKSWETSSSNIYTGMLIHAKTQKKERVEMLNNLGSPILYNPV